MTHVYGVESVMVEGLPTEGSLHRPPAGNSVLIESVRTNHQPIVRQVIENVCERPTGRSGILGDRVESRVVLVETASSVEHPINIAGALIESTDNDKVNSIGSCA